MRFPVAWNWLSKRDKEEESNVVASPVLQRRNATKRKSQRRTAPQVTERASSLYHRPSESVSSNNTASSNSSFDYTRSSTHSSYETHLYNLKENPSLYFPSPPPRVSIYNDRRHTDVWDDLFDYAEAHAVYAQPQQPAAYYSTLDLSETKFQKAKSNLFGLKGLAMKSEVWSKSFLNSMDSPSTPGDATPPAVPPRSRLRSNAPAPLTSQSTYQLAVDSPILESNTPPLSASGSSPHGSPPFLPQSPPADTIAFGRKKKSLAALGKDPLKVRDGAEPRRASSGVYTPTTFPGAAGPRPSHFPSHVYTPTNFVLNAASSAASSSAHTHSNGPSRSSSFSSAESDSPQTPGSRFSHLSGKALTGLKRISHQLPKTSQPPIISAPLSARDSYFPWSIHEPPRVWTPQTPVVSVKPLSNSPYDAQPFSPNGHGLGMGLTETHGSFVRPDDKSRPVSSVLFDESASESTAQKASLQARGRRKPVPKILDDPVQLKMDDLKI